MLLCDTGVLLAAAKRAARPGMPGPSGVDDQLCKPDHLEEDNPFAAHVGQVREQKVRAPLGAQAGAETFVVLPVQVDHGVAHDELAGDLLYLLAGFDGKAL